LEAHDVGTAKAADSGESSSSDSTSVEARLLGLTKSQLRQQRSVIAPEPDVDRQIAEAVRDADMETDDGVLSESTETKEPLTAVG
jgi:hypothetical protein